MNLLYFQLVERKDYLEKLLADITYKLKCSPNGKLRISNNKGKARYYYITNPRDTHGKYISKEEMDLVYQLAQKDYIQRLQRKVKKELQAINIYIKVHGENKLEHVYSELNEYRRNIVTPLVLSDEMYIKQWEEEQYETNPYCQEEKVYITKKDELVRSKSEVLLADMYYELGIPYRYEAQLQLRNGKNKYPDFTLINPNTREIMYHEHLGLLDNEEYRQKNLAKLDEYRRNGIYLGKNLIISYEGNGSYLNIREIKEMVRAIFGV